MGLNKHTQDQSSTSQAPALHGTVVTPHDTDEQFYRALYIGGGAPGNVNVRLLGDSTNTLFSAVPIGTILPIATKLVLATGTTSTLIVGLS